MTLKVKIIFFNIYTHYSYFRFYEQFYQTLFYLLLFIESNFYIILPNDTIMTFQEQFLESRQLSKSHTNTKPSFKDEEDISSIFKKLTC